MSRRRQYRGSISVDVDVDDLLEELSDDDLREEMKSRGLDLNEETESVSELSAEAMQDLICHRNEAAAQKIRRAISVFVPRDLIEAHEALNNGNIGEAICRLDSAAFQFKLPMKSETTKVNVAPSTDKE